MVLLSTQAVNRAVVMKNYVDGNICVNSNSWPEVFVIPGHYLHDGVELYLARPRLSPIFPSYISHGCAFSRLENKMSSQITREQIISAASVLSVTVQRKDFIVYPEHGNRMEIYYSEEDQAAFHSRMKTALHQAAAEGDSNLVQKFLDVGANIDEFDSLSNWTSVNFAIYAGHSDVLKLLLQCGASCDHPDYVGETPLYLAITVHSTEMVKALLRRGARVNRRNENGITPLCLATINSNAGIVEQLLEYGADPTDEALVIAADCVEPGNENTKIAKLLLERGCPVNMRNTWNETALFRATIEDNLEMVALLLEYGADVNALNGRDLKTALDVTDLYMFSTSSPDRQEIAQLLIKRGGKRKAALEDLCQHSTTARE